MFATDAAMDETKTTRLLRFGYTDSQGSRVEGRCPSLSQRILSTSLSLRPLSGHEDARARQSARYF